MLPRTLHPIAAPLAAALLAGCGTFSHYPTGVNQVVLGPMDRGEDLRPATAELVSRIQGRDEVLFASEAGRTAQLYGDYAASRDAFDKAIARTAAQGDEAVFAARVAAQQASAVLVNDKAIEYRAPAYEQALVHHYQALNYLGSRDLDGAGVEIRRANRVQEEALRQHDAEVAKAASRNDSSASDPLADAPSETRTAVSKAYAGLDELAGQAKNSFLNAAVFFLSAVVWEMRGEANDAYIDYKRALELAPSTPALQTSAIRLAKRLGMREDLADLSRRFPDAASTPAAGTEAYAGKAHLVVMVEEGHVAQKADLYIPFPVSGGLGAINIPVYGKCPSPAGRITLHVPGAPDAPLAPLCRISSLAARALSERMPGILARQIARAVAKSAALGAAGNIDGGHYHGHGHDQHSGGADAAVLLLSLYNVASEQADLRSWLTLPDTIQAAEAWPDASSGTATASLRWAGGGGIDLPVTLAPGKTTLLYVTRADWAFYSHAFVQP
ncbi:MAG: hypothetical protein IKQ55_08195 [Kiritimatiellae bacterium]|nr:hypothetical protein [Kiritimatiellia bacterium]